MSNSGLTDHRSNLRAAEVFMRRAYEIIDARVSRDEPLSEAEAQELRHRLGCSAAHMDEAVNAMSERPATVNGVIINGRSHDGIPGDLEYEALVAAAGLSGTPSATFRRDRFGKSGILSPGERVQPITGTVFSIAHTDNA